MRRALSPDGEGEGVGSVQQVHRARRQEHLLGQPFQAAEPPAERNHGASNQRGPEAVHPQQMPEACRFGGAFTAGSTDRA